MPELLEALDEKGRPIGQRKTWLGIISDGDWQNVVHVWIINSKGQTLVQQRAVKGAWDGLWDVSLGGTVSADEEPEQSAVRELQEELGIKIQEKELKKLGVWNVRKHMPEQNKESRQFSHTYLLEKDLEINNLALQAKEVRQAAWKSLDELWTEIKDDKLYKNWVPHPRKYYREVMNLIQEKS